MDWLYRDIVIDGLVVLGQRDRWTGYTGTSRFPMHVPSVALRAPQ